jgi:hypothetical protein
MARAEPCCEVANHIVFSGYVSLAASLSKTSKIGKYLDEDSIVGVIGWVRPVILLNRSAELATSINSSIGPFGDVCVQELDMISKTRAPDKHLRRGSSSDLTSIPVNCRHQ